MEVRRTLITGDNARTGNPVTVPGTSGSGNGGYVCGRVAAYADGPVAVTLRRPPPLATPMAVEQGDDGSLRVRHGSTLIAEATSPPGLLAPEVPDPVSLAEARRSAGPRAVLPGPGLPRVLCLRDEPPARRRAADLPRAGAGTGAVGGAVDAGFLGRGRGRRVRPEVAWAALDCPSGIAAAEHAGLGQDTAVVLGRMTASLAALPAPGDQCRVIAWPDGRDGRKLTAGSAILGPGGEVLAVARAVWMTVPRPVPGAGRGGSVMTARRGVGLTPMETRRDVIVRAAVLADELGYEVFAVPEGWGLDSSPVLTEIALRTATSRLASGVLSVWGRTPATLAMTAATLHQVSGGRYVLGLGTSTKALAEGFHGTPFEHPAAKLRDTVSSVRALLDGLPARSAGRGRAPAPPRPAPCPRGAHLGRRARRAHHPGGRRTRRRLDSRVRDP